MSAPTPSSASADGLGHDHIFLGADHDRNTRRTLWVVALTVAMMAAEIATGFLFNSMALLADGFHMATHAGALGLAAAAYAYARRHARDPRFSFGTGKVGDLAGFASALILGVIALWIAVESVLRLMDPADVAFGEAALVAVVGLLVNLASAALLAGGGHHHHGHGHGHHDHDHHRSPHTHPHGHGDPAEHPAWMQDNNMRSAVVHVLADALTSVLAILALLGGRYLGWAWLDPLMGIVGALVIAAWSWSLMRASAAVLLDVSDPDLEDEVRTQVATLPGARITDLHLWRVGPGAHAAIVSVAGYADGAAIRAALAPVHEIAHLTVELG